MGTASYALRPEYSLDPHQVVACKFYHTRERFGALLWSDVGLGKGFYGIQIICDWLNAGVTRVLVACPPGHTAMWMKKLFLYAGITASLFEEDKDTQVRIVGHSRFQKMKKGAKTKTGKALKSHDLIEQMAAWNPQAFMVDEGHKFRNYQASQTKGLAKLAGLCNPKYRVMLSATPTAQIDPEELRPQILFVDPELLHKYGVADWKSWRTTFCLIEYQRFGSVTIPKVTGVKNQALLDEIMSQVALVQEDKVLNLPPKHFHRCYFSMNKACGVVYRRVAKDGSYLGKELEVTTHGPAVAQMRLAQIRSGFVADYAGKIWDLDSTLITMVLDKLKEIGGKAVIVYRFDPTGDRLLKALQDAGVSAGQIKGGMGAKKSSAVEEKFQAGELDVVLGQIQAVSEGFTLTATNHMIVAEPEVAYIPWHQVLGRTRRRGQTKECHYWLMIEPATDDVDNYESLMAKKDFHKRVKKALVKEKRKR